MKLFEKHGEVPLNVLVEPFVEMLTLRLRGEKKKSITSAELQFVHEISSHPKLSEQSVLLILELITTIFLQKPVMGRLVLDMLVGLVDKY